jgi:hypothetical protein
MSEIRCIYQSGKPGFPATDQHPDAERFTVWSDFLGRSVIVDAVGGEPATKEVDAVLNPPAVTLTPLDKLAALGLTPEDIKAVLSERQV